MANIVNLSETSLLPRKTASITSLDTTGAALSSETRRSKRSISKFDILSTPATPPARKRVNPESLAARLGPQLVKELEAMLKPGLTEMPPFVARQALQKRFNINRRHIYDWFHSKGLRVTKEDTRATEDSLSGPARPQKFPRLAKQPRPPSSSILDTSTRAGSGSGPSSLGLGIFTASAQTIPTLGAHAGYGTPGELYTWPTGGAPELVNFDVSDFQGSPTSSITVPGTRTLMSNLSEEPSTVLLPGEINQQAAISRSVGFAEQSTGVALDPDASKENVNPMLALVSQGYLSEAERQAVYNGLSHALGPASGIQESVGTYKAFMMEQRQLYYERLIPVEVASPVSDAVSESGLTVDSPAIMTPGSASTPYVQLQSTLLRSEVSTSSPAVSEYHGWLLGGSRSLPSSIVSSRIHTPDLSSDAGPNTSRFWAPEISDSAYSSPALDLGDILESPVLRSRHPTAEQPKNPPTEHEQQLAEQELHPTWVYAPGCRQFSVPLAPVYRPELLRHGHSWEDPRMAPFAHFSAASVSRWEHSEFSLTLQDAKAHRGLEKMMSDKSKGKARTRTRPGAIRDQADPAGGQ